MNSKKTLLIILLACLTCCLGILVFSGCTLQDDDDQHYCYPSCHVPVPATCTSQGNIEYWYCRVCGTYYSDMDGKHKIEAEQTILDINPDNHKYTGPYSYDYDELVYTRICTYNNEHIEKQSAGSKEYPFLVRNADELEKAIAEDGYIKLENDITVDSGVKIQSKNRVQIDLNGKTISGSGQYVFYIDISDNDKAFTRILNGTIRCTNSSADTRSGLYIVTGACIPSVYLTDCVIEVNEQGNSGIGVGVYVHGNDTDKMVVVNLTSCAIYADFAGVYFDGSSRLALSKTDITASSYGIYDNFGSNAEMMDGSITAATGVRSLYMFSMNGGSITATDLAISIKHSSYDYPPFDWDKIEPDVFLNIMTFLNIDKATITSGGTGIELQTTFGKVKNTIINTKGDSIKTFRDVILEMNHCEISSENGMGIVGNGTVDINDANCGIKNNIKLTDCSIAATWGVYLPQTDGRFEMSGGNIQASVTGIEIRSGKVRLKGVEIVSNAKAFSTDKENAASGACILGAAVAVSQNSANNEIVVNVEDCTLKGVYAFYEEDLIDNVSENLTVTFEGTNNFDGGVYSQNCSNLTEVNSKDPV